MNERSVLADTNVASYLLRSRSIGEEYRQLMSKASINLSFVTAAEMLFGAEVGRWGAARREVLNRFLARYPILGYESGMERTYACIAADCQRVGRRLDWRDAWICTQALWFEIPLVTHDRDFDGIVGLQIVTLLSMQIRDSVCAYEEPYWPRRSADLVLFSAL